MNQGLLLSNTRRKFEYVYKDDDGFESIWKYDLDKYKNGPISVENKYPIGYANELKVKNKHSKLVKNLSAKLRTNKAKKYENNGVIKYW